MWKVQTGKNRKSSYVTRYSFEDANERQAVLYYNSLNTFGGGKKRLINPDGKIVVRLTT